MCMSAINSTPANPPPTNATNSHQAETILAPEVVWSDARHNGRPGGASLTTSQRSNRWSSAVSLIPAQCATGLILDDARLEKVLLLLQIDHLRHPRERVVRLVEQRVDADLLAAAVGDEAQVLLEHGGVESQHAARHGVLGVGV